MNRTTSKFKKELTQYKLKDYQFLQDYQIIDNNTLNKHIFTAKIKNTNQKVRFIKKKYSDQSFQRFKTLHRLYKNGVILADNMFIVEECETLYFYIIQAEIQISNSRFQTLQQYMYMNNLIQQQRKSIIVKIKILLDCLNQEGQYYGGLNTRNIIIDDQKHIFLTPYSIDIELKHDFFNRAYYSLQLLQKISKEENQINEEMIMKWDIWSFGCIATEVLLYNSPIFLSTSINSQIKMINSFQTQQQTQKLQQNLKNLIINSLNKDIQKRSSSIHKVKEESNKNFNKTVKKPVKNLFPIKNDQQYNQTQQVNLYLQDQQGDSELTLHLNTLQNIKIQNQLHIIIHLQKKYHFYIDPKPEQLKYNINKKITIRKDFQYFTQLLTNPVLIELKEDNNSSFISINLQTLTLMSQGRRIWNKKLLGRYKTQDKGPFVNTKLKISCQLKSPQVFIQQQIKSKAQNTSIDLKIQNQIQISSNQENLLKQLIFSKEKSENTQQNFLKQITNMPIKKKKKKNIIKNEQIPSISQISNTISSITQQFKKKLKINQQTQQKDDKNNEIQYSLQDLLKIQH